ncbi:hypothetical protein BSL78_14252 [Apostichopus japonicus]|uniref:Uncharacterized protein n=1 Tax=Stichopus japonicus TaxID=307972 RepID=A0A2G8KLK0_STIJA|nr:hypothetical protein BSL78_14252 [Apostichopus japonicus]
MEKTAMPTTASASQPKAPITKPAFANNDEQKKVTTYASVTSKPKASVINVLAATSSTNNKDMKKHAMPTTASVSQPKAPTTKPLEAKPAPAHCDKQMKETSYASVTSKPRARVSNVVATTSSTKNKDMKKHEMPTSASQPKASKTKPALVHSNQQKIVTSYTSVTSMPNATDAKVLAAIPAIKKMKQATNPVSASQPKAPITKPATVNSDEHKKVTSYASVTSKPNASVINVLAAKSSTNNKEMQEHAMPTTASVSQPKATITKPAPANNDEQKKVTTYASTTGKPKASEGNVLATAPATDKLEKTAKPTTASASQPKAPIPKPAPANNDEQKKVSSYASMTGKPKAAENQVLATAPATDKLKKTAIPTTASASQPKAPITKPAFANNDEQKKVTSYASTTGKPKASEGNVLATAPATDKLEKTAMPTTASASQPKAPIPKPAPANNDEQKKVSSYAASMTGKPKAAENQVLATAPATDRMEKTAMPTTASASQPKAPITKPAFANNDEQKKVTSYASVTSKPKARVNNVFADMKKTAIPTTTSVIQPYATTSTPLLRKPAPAHCDASLTSKIKSSTTKAATPASRKMIKLTQLTTASAIPQKATTLKPLVRRPASHNCVEQRKVPSYAFVTSKPKAAATKLLAATPTSNKTQKATMPTRTAPTSKPVKCNPALTDNNVHKRKTCYASGTSQSQFTSHIASTTTPAPANNGMRKNVASCASRQHKVTTTSDKREDQMQKDQEGPAVRPKVRMMSTGQYNRQRCDRRDYEDSSSESERDTAVRSKVKRLKKRKQMTAANHATPLDEDEDQFPSDCTQAARRKAKKKKAKVSKITEEATGATAAGAEKPSSETEKKGRKSPKPSSAAEIMAYFLGPDDAPCNIILNFDSDFEFKLPWGPEIKKPLYNTTEVVPPRVPLPDWAEYDKVGISTMKQCWSCPDEVNESNCTSKTAASGHKSVKSVDCRKTICLYSRNAFIPKLLSLSLIDQSRHSKWKGPRWLGEGHSGEEV